MNLPHKNAKLSVESSDASSKVEGYGSQSLWTTNVMKILEAMPRILSKHHVITHTD